MRGQRGSLPVQALGYVNSTKVILGLPETAAVHFLLRPHHYILKVITQFRVVGPRWNTSMEASFTGILERNGISGWINQRGIYIYIYNLLGLKWHMQKGGNAVLSGQQKQQNVSAGRVIKVVAARLSWTMPCGFFKWSLRDHGLGHKYWQGQWDVLLTLKIESLH